MTLGLRRWHYAASTHSATSIDAYGAQAAESLKNFFLGGGKKKKKKKKENVTAVAHLWRGALASVPYGSFAGCCSAFE